MRKDINIRITLTDEPIDLSNSQQTGPNSWHITVSSKDGNMPASLEGKKGVGLAILSHELGHALGQSLQGEIVSKDERFDSNFFGIVSPNVLKEENRAWQIGGEVFDQVKDYALGTYKRNLQAE